MMSKTIKHEDYEEIQPPSLKKAVVRIGPGSEIDFSAVARAEAALAAASSEFGEWMREEVERIEAARLAFERAPDDAKARDTLFRAAHDIRGHGQTLGYPLAGAIADGLCDFMERMPAFEPPHRALVEAHIDAIRAVVRGGVKDGGDRTLQMLLSALANAREALLAAGGAAPGAAGA
jgi:chemotaxis protein histidine kinase CheA